MTLVGRRLTSFTFAATVAANVTFVGARRAGPGGGETDAGSLAAMRIVERLKRNGASDPIARVGELTEANRAERDPTREAELVAARHAAFDAVAYDAASVGPSPLPQAAQTTRFREGEVATIDASELSPEVIAEAFAACGCLHVRGVLDRATADGLRATIDKAFAAAEQVADNGQADADPALAGWHAPFRAAGSEKLAIERRFAKAATGVWCADSPPAMFDLLEAFEGAGLRELIGGYLGARPALSVNKCTLRRVPANIPPANAWHQDGAFLGTEIRALNLWLAVSDSGVDAPGLEIVPKRLEEIVETGTEGASLDWTVSPGVVERVAGSAGIARPEFTAGDLMLFDERLLHQTGISPGMTETRYAVEAWFFSPLAYPDPDRQIPLVF